MFRWWSSEFDPLRNNPLPKDDLKQFRAACRLEGVEGDDLFEFSEYLHDLKRSGQRGSGKNGDFTFEELRAIIREYKGEA
jgi:hypothetical protein